MKCFYHNDHDGRCAAYVVAKYFDNFNRNDFFEVNYSDKLPIDNLEKEVVIFVDYSFTKDTCHIIDQLKKQKCYVVWIDHHKSSMEIADTYGYIKGIRNTSLSGAALAWCYYYNGGDIFNIKDMPEFIKYIDDYDRWQYKFGNITDYVKLGIEAHPYDFNDDIWRLLDTEDYLDEVIKDGKVISKYMENNNKYYTELWGYETTIDGIKAIAVNRKSNSLLFGDLLDTYPIGISFAFDGNKYVYTLFTKDDNIDCSKIAAKFGGGGHKGAAGFQTKDLIIKLDGSTIRDLKKEGKL